MTFVNAGLTPFPRPAAVQNPLYRFIRWNRLKVFDWIFKALVEKGGKPDQRMIDLAL